MSRIILRLLPFHLLETQSVNSDLDPKGKHGWGSAFKRFRFRRVCRKSSSSWYRYLCVLTPMQPANVPVGGVLRQGSGSIKELKGRRR